MKIAVVGAGAMGSVYAALLADAGNEVWALDTWAEHVQAMREKGLRVEGASGDRTVAVNATSDPAEPGPCDLVILATKAAGVADAARAMGPLLSSRTSVLTIQNGLGAAERICEHLPAERVLLGVAGGFGASMRGPGHAHHNGMQLIRIGELGGGISERAEQIAEVWRGAGFNVRCYEDMQQLVWEKFICNVTFSGPSTVFDRTLGELMAAPECWHVALSCGLEAHAVGVREGINFSFDDAAAYITDFGSRMPGAEPSMLQDARARRHSEIDAINGMVPVIAARHGMQAPFNEVISALVRQRESEY